MKTLPLTRRRFLHRGGLASAAALAFPAIGRAQPGGGLANDKLNIAYVGVGGRGRNAVLELQDENRVAFCDVDDARAAVTYEKFPDVPRFRDYRVMLDRLGREIDAVRITTPDHMHFPVAMAAMALGKHVFVEKPLTHTIAEARTLARVARERKVATQMGNQGHANEGLRRLKEWFEAGVLGEVREVHSWTNRPGWAQGIALPDHSQGAPPVPATLDWDLWQGVAAERAYDPAFLPFRWRGFWAYGNGALGDMACHLLDGAYWALELGAPEWVEAVSAKGTAFSAPASAVITYQFPARGARPPVKLTWYDGGNKPVLPDAWEAGRKLPENGTLLVGSRATVLADTYYGSVRIVPETRMQELATSLPPKTLPRCTVGHYKEWGAACNGGPAAGSNFDYAAPFSEVVLLGNIALRTGRRVVWDAAAMRITNDPEANRLLTKDYRPGFGV